MAYMIGVLTASFSFLANRALLKYIGLQTIISFSPMLEEVAKTLLSYFLGADILAAHLTFGILEGVYDWHNSSKNKLWAAISSVFGHGIFGLVTVGFLSWYGIWLGLLSGIVVHLVWNRAVVYFGTSKSRSEKK